MKVIRIILVIVVVLITAIVITLVLPIARASSEPTQQPFDHSNCQYPTRWSNPVDGCDNSDPASPECVGKGSTQAEEQACIEALNNPQTPTVIPAPEKVSQCGDQ